MSNLPPKDDHERSEREREAIEARNKLGQVTGALKEGVLPSTEQVTRTIETVQQSDIFQDVPREVSPLGKKVLADAEKLLETTKQIFEEKNVGDELQNAIYYGGKASKGFGESVSVPEDLKHRASSEADASQSILQDAFKKTLMVPQLLISSSEFRKLINDVHSIIQDALLRAIPDRDPEDTDATFGSDQEKTIQQAAQETKQQAREGTYPVAKEAADITGTHIKDYSEGKKGFQETATGGAKQLATHFKDKFSGYEITEEQRDRLVTRFKNIMIETQSKPEYQSVLEDLIDLISRIAERSQDVTGQVKDATKQQVNDEHKSDIQKAQENAKRLIENFANHKSLDPLINALKDLAKNVQRDEDLRSYLRELRQFADSSLRDPQFVQETDYVQHGSNLIDRGRYLLLDRYSDYTKRISDEAIEFNRALQDDRLTTQWAQDFENLTRDLFLDEKGWPTVKFELLKDFSKILPVIGEKFKYIALPKFENSDEEYEYVFDNIVLHLEEAVPKHLHMNFTTDINLDRDEKDVLQNTAYFEISKINADARNIAFYYKKKKGLINMMDIGLVDFSIPKHGLTIKLKVLLNPPSDQNSNIDLKVLSANTIIDDLKLRLHDTRHNFLYTVLTPLVEKRLKKQLSSTISDKMVQSIDYMRETVGKAQTKARSQMNDLNRKRKESKESKVSKAAYGGDKKQKHAWEGQQHYDSGTQVREE